MSEIHKKPNQELEPTFPTLYRREGNFLSRAEEKIIGKGPNQAQELNITFDSPGWIAIDLATSVAHTNKGEIALGRLQVYIDDELRHTMRGSYTWTRIYLYVDAGRRNIVLKTDENYKPNDMAWYRHLNATAFVKVDSIDTIYKCPPPSPLQDLKRFKIVNGYDRYQQSGPGGMELEMEMVISNKNGRTAPENYRDFISKFTNFYVLKYRNGLYGGLLSDPEVKNIGPITIVKCKFISPNDAGEMLARELNV